MVTKSYNSLGYDLNLSVPGSVEEYDQLAKRVGACLDDAIKNVVYRGVFATFRTKFAELIENNTGIARKTEPVLDKSGKPKTEEDGTPMLRFVETEKVYFDRVCAVLVSESKFASTEAAAASFASDAQTIMSAIVFDPSETEREPSQPKKVAKAYITIATKMEEKGILAAKAQELATKLGNWKVDATVDSVAKAIAEDQRRIREATNVGSQYGV